MLGFAAERIDRLILLNTFAYRDGRYPPHNLDGKSQAWDDVLHVVTEGEILGMTLFSLVIKEGVIDQRLCTTNMVSGYWQPIAGSSVCPRPWRQVRSGSHIRGSEALHSGRAAGNREPTHHPIHG